MSGPFCSAVAEAEVGAIDPHAMENDGNAIGATGLYRREILPFLPQQIALVETFAAQAVIAIENVHQFREVQERLEREKATGEVLGVISRSRSDDTPVFDVILENSARLCNASNANLTLLSETKDSVRLVASPVIQAICGYRCRSFVLASSVVKCHLVFVCALFRFWNQALTSVSNDT